MAFLRDLLNLRIIFILLTGSYLLAQDSSAVQNSGQAAFEQSTIELRTHLPKQETPLNRSIEFQVSLTWIGDMSRYQIVQIPQPVLTNLLLEGSGSSNRLEDLGGGQFRSIKTITFQLKPVEIGMAYIDGLQINYRDTKTEEMDVLFSQRLEVKVLDPLPESSGDMKGIVYVVLLIVFFGAVLYFLLMFLRKRRAAQVVETPEISRAEMVLKELSQNVDPKGTNLSEMTLRMSKIFREYLSGEFGVSTTESNTEKIIERLTDSGVEDAQLMKLRELFQKLDMIKFAGGAVNPPEFSNMYGIVENFLIERQKLWEAENLQMKEA